MGQRLRHPTGQHFETVDAENKIKNHYVGQISNFEEENFSTSTIYQA